MLGWIKKIGATTGSGSGGNGESDSRSRAGPGQNGDAPPPLSSSASFTSRSGRTLFLDAVGSMGRSSRKNKDGSKNKDSNSAAAAAAAAAADQLDAQRAEKISCVAFKLVREIQRILKEARETQTSSASAPTPRTPAATPSPPPPRGRQAAGARTSSKAAVTATTVAGAAGAGSEADESGAKRNRWAGTEELLNLLNGGSLGGEAEDRVRGYDSIAEVQAKMEDLVEQALVPESHGDLCGILLEEASASGGGDRHHHPAFVKLCVDAGLPSNLVHCLRIMRVVEFESAMHDSEDNNDNSKNDDDMATVVAGESFGSGEDEAVEVDSGKIEAEGGREEGAEEDAIIIGQKASAAAAVAPAVPERPLTERATERIGRLLVTLCRDKSAGVGEQIKPHLPGLLSLAVSAYPPNGAHVQETARSVVEALMGGCLNSSMVWLLHYNKVRGKCRATIPCRTYAAVYVTSCSRV